MKEQINRLRPHRLAILVLVLAPLLLFYKVLNYDFSPMDEQWLILRKFDYLNSWRNLFNAFYDQVAQTYYRPLLTVTFIIDAHTGGLKPFAWHLTNILLHAACVLLLYRFLLQLKSNRQTALLLSLLFAVHPALVHAVVWIPGRNDVLLTLFALLSFIFLISYAESAKKKWLWLHLLAFAGTLLSKESAVILPVVYVALLYYKKWPIKQYLWPAIGWLLLIAAWYFAKVTVLPKVELPVAKSVGVTAWHMLQAFVIYIGNCVWPVHPSVTPTVANSSLTAGLVVLGALVVLTWLSGLRDRKLAGIGVLIFFACLLLPVYFGATSILGEHYEHRIYLPLVGFIVFISQLNFPENKTSTAAVFLCLTAAYAAKTWSRFEVYSNDLSYVEEGIEDSPKNYVYHLLKGNALFNRKRLNESLVYFDEAIRLQPNRVQALANRANVYVMMHEKELALADLNAALKIDHNPNLFLNRFNTYYVFKDYENALRDMEALKKMSGFFTLDIPPEVQRTLDNYVKERDAKNKLPLINQAIAAEPKKAELYVHRARTLGIMKQWPEALADLKKACELEPANAEYKSFYETLKGNLEKKKLPGTVTQ